MTEKEQQLSKSVTVKADLEKLDQLVRTLAESSGMYVKVGILAKKDARKDSESNASIGLVHEFGSMSNHIPQRSFLSMPLTTKSKELVDEVRVLAVDNLLEGDMTSLFKKIGVAAEGIIEDAFKTGGFGTWSPIQPATAKRKGSDAILIETGQLRRAITSAVVKS